MKMLPSELQTALEDSLSGKRLNASRIRVIDIKAESEPAGGIMTVSGTVLFFDQEMGFSAMIQANNNALISLSIQPRNNSLVNATFDLIESFLAGDAGIENGHKLTDFFPTAFPTGLISVKEISMGFDETRSTPSIQSIEVRIGTDSTWKVLDTANFDIDQITVGLSNDDLSLGFKNTALSIAGKFSFSTIEMELAVNNIFLGNPAEVFENLELNATLTGNTTPIPVDAHMSKILPDFAYQQWQDLAPNDLKNPTITELSLNLQPGKPAFDVVVKSNLGELEVMGKPVTGSTTGRRNIMLALTPPSEGSGSFFGEIGKNGTTPGPLAKLDTLGLKNSGIIFSTFEDEVETSLSALQAHQSAANTLKVVDGIQFFSTISFTDAQSSQSEDKKMVSGLFGRQGSKIKFDGDFTLSGSIQKDLTAELEVGIAFGSHGFQIIPNHDELILREVGLALILNPIPGYAGFRIRGRLETHIEEADLGFDSYMQFGVLTAGPTIEMAVGLGIQALNGSSPMINGVPAVWDNAFGIPGLGLQEIGGNIGMGIQTATTPFPTPVLTALGLKGTLLLGTVPGEKVHTEAEFQLDVDKLSDSKIHTVLKNTTLLDMIEAYDENQKFNLTGPLREMLDVGFNNLDVTIDPANQEFYFNAKLNLGELKAQTTVKF
ncbi:MAG: hypothetical protein KDD99_25985, partial [Bacteroidetes bacterium]|nr:hypothetical protein [Bacteroidota bacterium]